MTSDRHPTGTDRLAEVSRELPEAELILNVQGDEPLSSPVAIDELIEAFAGSPDQQMATLMTPLAEPDYANPAAVKVVATLDRHALYFSRSLIPYPRNPDEATRHFKHIGVYAYRRDFLLRFAALPPTPLEKTESLEQLRALEHGYRIRLIETQFQPIGVDTPEDLERVRQLLISNESV